MNSKTSIATQLNRLYTLSNFIILAVVSGATIGFVWGTGDTIGTMSKNTIFGQASQHSQYVISGNAELFANRLVTLADHNLRVYMRAVADTFRPDYNMMPIQSYPDVGDSYLKQPLVQDSRQSKPVSFQATSYYYPNITATNLQYLTLGQNQTRDTTVHVDPFIKNGYEMFEDVIANYAGFDNGLHRHYPGISTMDTDPLRLYDPRQRDWYTSTDLYHDSETVYSSPYQDFNGKGWMITLSQKIIYTFNNSHDIKGVAGVDMLISTLNQDIRLFEKFFQ